MKKTFKLSILVASIISASSFSAIAQESTNDGVNSTVDLNFRYRVETVDQSGIAENALASTLRTRATIKTHWSDNFDSVIEFDEVTEVGANDFNSGMGTSSANRGQYPIVADPKGSDLNQAFVRFTTGDSKIALGRQRILIGSQRFVGGVGWRQNEQTYDSLTYKSKISDDFNLTYAYVYNVNRIFGTTVGAGDHQHNTHLLNADYKIGNGKVSAYYFSIDNEDAAGLSNNTFGVSYAGKVNDFSYTVEYASQSDNADNANDYSASYYLLDGKYNIGNGSIGIGQEVLGGDTDGGQAFTTSLATLHKFQGWADVFLSTPLAGIEDTYLNASYKVSGFKFKAVYHDFSTDEGSDSLGTEFDLAIAKKFTKKLGGLLKLASFNSDNAAYASRDKVWFMLTYKL